MIIDGYGSSEAGGQGQSVTVAGATPSDGPRFRVNDETTVLTSDFTPAPVGVVGKLARRGHIPLGYYKDPEKTARDVPGRRTASAGPSPATTPASRRTARSRCSDAARCRSTPAARRCTRKRSSPRSRRTRTSWTRSSSACPDARWGERVVALDRAAGRPHGRHRPRSTEPCARHVAGYKAPRDILVVDAIVRSPSGKPDYRWGKATAISRLAADQAEPSAS